MQEIWVLFLSFEFFPWVLRFFSLSFFFDGQKTSLVYLYLFPVAPTTMEAFLTTAAASSFSLASFWINAVVELWIERHFSLWNSWKMQTFLQISENFRELWMVLFTIKGGKFEIEKRLRDDAHFPRFRLLPGKSGKWEIKAFLGGDKINWWYSAKYPWI